MANDTRLHNFDLGGKKTVEIAIHTPLFDVPNRVAMLARDEEGSATVLLSPDAARAIAALLVAAASEVDARNASKPRAA